ncbi:MAG: hypothetical protein QF464_07555 [Myxococcota bacterium]|nr:hypothetical protein [Myxococcota bacterium]
MSRDVAPLCADQVVRLGTREDQGVGVDDRLLSSHDGSDGRLLRRAFVHLVGPQEVVQERLLVRLLLGLPVVGHGRR